MTTPSATGVCGSDAVLTFEGASFKVQSDSSLLRQVAEPVSSLTIGKLPKGDSVRRGSGSRHGLVREPKPVICDPLTWLNVYS